MSAFAARLENNKKACTVIAVSPIDYRRRDLRARPDGPHLARQLIRLVLVQTTSDGDQTGAQVRDVGTFRGVPPR
jgi:hypothetical protein